MTFLVVPASFILLFYDLYPIEVLKINILSLIYIFFLICSAYKAVNSI